MNDRLQTQLFGPYLSSFSAHSYSYELSNEPDLFSNFRAFASAPILGQPPSVSEWAQINPSCSWGMMPPLN